MFPPPDRSLLKPTHTDIPPVTSDAAGTDHGFALTDDGEAYSWGFSENGRTGQGTENDIKVPTLIDDKAIRGKKVAIASASESFSSVAA